MMKVIVENHSGSSFSIDVGFSDTVLTIKQKIEKSQGTPVFKQTLFFQGKVLQDHLDIFQCHILHTSRLLLSISPDDNPNQNNNDQVPQTKQSPSAPSNPIHAFVHNQDSPVMSNKDQVLKPEESPMKEFFGIQDSPEGKNNQVLHQTEQSPLPSNSFGETIYGRGRALTTEQFSKSQHDRPVTPHKITYVAARRINNESSRPSYSLDGLLGPQDLLPVTVLEQEKQESSGSNETEQSSPSDSVKEVINIPDSPEKKKIKTSPMKLTVMVQPYEETRKIPVEVNAGDNIKELRKELVKMQKRGELDLPHEGYFFVYKKNTLTEARSFFWNGVADGDTIEISRIAVYP